MSGYSVRGEKIIPFSSTRSQHDCGPFVGLKKKKKKLSIRFLSSPSSPQHKGSTQWSKHQPGNKEEKKWFKSCHSKEQI